MNSKKTMLIVDDKRVNRFTLKTIFEDDFIITECANGREAIEIIREEKNISIILLDIIMPECDGFEVLKFMRESDKNDTPVILITASEDEEQIKKGFSLQVDDFIHKPFDEEVVKQRVNHVLDTYNKAR